MVQLVGCVMTAEEVNVATLAVKKVRIEPVMGTELDHHLGYLRVQAGNDSNGTSGGKMLTGEGPVRLDFPRDRDGSFNRIVIPKHARRFTGFDDRIIAMTRGMHDHVRNPGLCQVTVEAVVTKHRGAAQRYRAARSHRTRQAAVTG